VPTASDATRQQNMKIETIVPNLAWSIFIRGISLTAIEPSRAKHMPNPNDPLKPTIWVQMLNSILRSPCS